VSTTAGGRRGVEERRGEYIYPVFSMAITPRVDPGAVSEWVSV